MAKVKPSLTVARDVTPPSKVYQMTEMAIAFAAISALAAPAAQAKTTVADTDFSRWKSWVLAFPDLIPEVFAVADADAVGALSADELKAAQTAGTIPA